MKTKHVLLSLLVALVIVGCCIPTPTQPPAAVIHRESIELVGFNPSTPQQKADFEAVLNKYNAKDPAIFKISRYNGDKHNPTVFGAMTDIGCDLEGMIVFWLDGGPVGKMPHTTGITDYAGRIGMTCSTSCPGHFDNSKKMVDEVNAVIGKQHGRKHHH